MRLFPPSPSNTDVQPKPYYFFEKTALNDAFRVSGFNNTIYISDCKTQEILAELNGHSTFITTVTISVDNRLIASADINKVVKIWDTDSQTCIHTFEGSAEIISHIAFTDDSHFLLCGFDQLAKQRREIEVFDIKTAKTLQKLTCGICVQETETELELWGWEIGALLISEEGEVTAGLESQLKHKRDNETLVSIWPDSVGLGRNYEIINEISIIEVDQCILTIWDEVVKVWDVKKGICIHNFNHGKRIGSASLSPDKTQLATTSHLDERVVIWDLKTNECLHILQHCLQLKYLTFSHHGQYLASQGAGVVKVWNAKTWQEWYEIKTKYALNHLTFSPNDELFCVARSHHVAIYQSETGDCLYQTELKRDFESRPAPPPSPPAKVTAHQELTMDQEIERLKSMQFYVPRVVRHGSDVKISCLIFDENNQFIAFGLDDYTVRILNCETWDWQTWYGHQSPIEKITIDKENHTLCTIDKNDERKIWPLQVRTCTLQT